MKNCNDPNSCDVIISHMLLPEDANPAGNIHGGVIMKHIDNAAGVVAIRHTRTNVVTASIDRLDFHYPAYVGNLLTLYARINLVGTTSMEIGVEAVAEKLLTGESNTIASAYLTFVALDAQGNPTKVPPLELKTQADHLRHQRALKRKAMRLGMLNCQQQTDEETCCMDESYHYPASPRIAVGAVVVHQKRVLLVQRGKPPKKGLWSIPGGSVKLGESLQQAAEREVLEETGIQIQAGRPIFTFDTVEKDSIGNVRFHYVVVDLDARYLGGNLAAATDADDAAWVGEDELHRYQLTPVVLTLLQEHYSFGRKSSHSVSTESETASDSGT